MPESERSDAAAGHQPPGPDAPVAGVRQDGGHLLFVRGVPSDAPSGARIRFEHDGHIQEGAVSIPPSLLAWCDPSVECGRFLALAPPPVAPPSGVPARQPLDLLVAAEGAPDAATTADMLALAFAEQHRLADEGTYRPRRERDRRE